MADGGFVFCDGDDPGEQFNRNEAISAVADDGFLGDDDDDDYEDLYNDVNVGEGFLQSLSKNEELMFKIDDKKVESSAAPVQDLADCSYSIPVAPVDDSGEGVEDMKLEETGGADCSPKIPKKIDEFPDDEYKVKELGVQGSISGNTTGEGVVASGGAIRVELVQSSSKLNDFEGKIFGDHRLPQQIHGSPVMNTVSDGILKNPGISNMNSVEGMGMGNGGGGSGGGGGTILFVGDLHWWTTDAELEGELCKYGSVKEVKFFDEKASGKSKGYCQVEFYESSAAISCKEGMNGYTFNGRPCVVAFASPFSVKRMGEAQVNKTQQIANSAFSQARRPVESIGKSVGGNIPSGVNYQSGDGGRYGRGSWGRGNLPGAGSRNQIGPMRNRSGNMGGRGIMGNGANGFGQGISAASSILHSQAMMGQGFDPTIGGTMGRMGNYGGFPAVPTPSFSGILSSFPSVGGVGLPGVAPHVNPAFFGRGMAMGGMGMMPTSGVEGSNMGMWSDPNMMGWAGEDHGGRAGESSYGEEAVSEHHYREGSHERGAWMNTGKEKDRGSERDWSASSERWHRDDRELGYDRDQSREKEQAPDSEWADRRHRSDKDISRDRDRERDRDHGRSRDRERDRDRDRERERDRERDRPRDDRDKYSDHHRHRDREIDNDDDRERGRSSRTHSKSRLSQEDEQRSRSRDADFGKRRRVTSE